MANTLEEYQQLVGYLCQLDAPALIGFEATGNYHRPLAYFLHAQGSALRLIPTMALALTREAMHNPWDLKFCGINLSTQQSGRFRGISRLSKYGNARLRTAFWMAAKTAVRMRENSLRRKFDRYVRANPLDADLRRKAYNAVAAKLARIVHGLIKNGTDYRPFFEEAIPGG